MTIHHQQYSHKKKKKLSQGFLFSETGQKRPKIAQIRLNINKTVKTVLRDN